MVLHHCGAVGDDQMVTMVDAAQNGAEVGLVMDSLQVTLLTGNGAETAAAAAASEDVVLEHLGPAAAFSI